MKYLLPSPLFNAEQQYIFMKLFGAILSAVTSSNNISTTHSANFSPNRSQSTIHHIIICQPPFSAPILFLLPLLLHSLPISHVLLLCCSWMLQAKQARHLTQMLSKVFYSSITRTTLPLQLQQWRPNLLKHELPIAPSNFRFRGTYPRPASFLQNAHSLPTFKTSS